MPGRCLTLKRPAGRPAFQSDSLALHQPHLFLAALSDAAVGKGTGMGSSAGISHEVGFGIERGPRPEATALRWFDLLPATQKALEELINWLYAASHSRQEAAAGSSSKTQGSEEQLATSALVSGDRGFGKTTVLLSTAYALRAPGEFTRPRDDGASSPLADPRARARCERLVATLDKLRDRIVWLDPLDMEPLPTQANLLATLLVRVRNALDLSPERKRKDRWAPPSLLEEGLNDPYGKIDKLVRDATFMWEDIPVQGMDPRQRAEQQIKAAEIYATFRRDFFDAMDSVSRLLAERRFGHGSQEKVLLVLPIDNVDRSIQHLHLILKLTRMVASRQLWFVLASGRSEFQLFLERSFQMELTSSGQTPVGLKSQEETLSIARRQAAAAIRRVLPPIHRIQIESITPRGAWDFEAPAPLSGSAHDARRLSFFLEKIRLPWSEEESHGLKCFADLFDIRDRLIAWEEKDAAKPKDTSLLAEYGQLLREQGDLTPEDAERLRGFIRNGARGSTPPLFSYAAKLALTLSARTVLDLWQAVRAAAEETQRHEEKGHPLPDGTSEPQESTKTRCETCDEQAIKIAEAMLRASIDESDLPGWASEQLLNRIMRRNAQGRIVLDLTGRPVQRLKRTILSDVLEWGPEERASGPLELLRTELHLRHIQDVILELHDLDRTGRKVLMPPNVAGWFMLMHDMLVLSRERRVMNISANTGEMIPEVAVTLHEALLRPPGGRLDAELKFWWLLPNWNTFVDFVIFITQWKAFLHRVQRLFQIDAATSDEARPLAADRFSFVMAAWIDNVCSVAGDKRGGWDWALLGQVVGRAQKAFQRGGPLSLYVRSVMDNVETLSKKAWAERSSYHRLGIASSWLEECLPLLLGAEFIPPASRMQFETALETPPPGPSGRAWWNRHRGLDSGLLKQRQYDLVRGAVERSRAYKRYKKAQGKGGDGWLARACDGWLALWKTPGKKKTRESRKVPRTGELRVPPAAQHRRGRVRAKGRRGPRT